jgi:hypothetical protein
MRCEKVVDVETYFWETLQYVSQFSRVGARGVDVTQAVRHTLRLDNAWALSSRGDQLRKNSRP